MNKTLFVICTVFTMYLCLLVSGCATASGGCPFCGYPPGVRLDGDQVTCQRCSGIYSVYLDGSVYAIQRPQQQVITSVPTDNTNKSQQDLNQTGLLLLNTLK